MENSTIILTLLSTLLANYMAAESIEISTSLPMQSSTFKPYEGNYVEADGKPNNFLNTVENYLSEDSNSQNAESSKPIQGYLPHAMIPVYPQYNAGGYFYPGVNPATTNNDVRSNNYFSSVLPIAQAALHAGLKLFARVGLFAIGGAALLVIGGFFTTIVCYVTPICTITFNGYDFKALNKETVRSLMTPEKIASAAALVQDAIGKYQRLQRAVGQ